MFLCRLRRREQALPTVLVTCVFSSVPLLDPAWAIIYLWGRTASLYRDREHVYCRRPWLVMICSGLAVSACCFRLTRFGPAQDKFGFNGYVSAANIRARCNLREGGVPRKGTILRKGRKSISPGRLPPFQELVAITIVGNTPPPRIQSARQNSVKSRGG